jgi:hypothetical protein
MDPRADLNWMVKREICCPFQESKPVMTLLCLSYGGHYIPAVVLPVQVMREYPGMHTKFSNRLLKGSGGYQLTDFNINSHS